MTKLGESLRGTLIGRDPPRLRGHTQALKRNDRQAATHDRALLGRGRCDHSSEPSAGRDRLPYPQIWPDILRYLFAESQCVRKSLSADISRMSGSAIGFEMTARRESRLGVASSSSGLRMIRSSDSALRREEQNLAWTDHFAGRQSLANKNMDSPEAQLYSR